MNQFHRVQQNSHGKEEPSVAVYDFLLSRPNHYVSGGYESYLEAWRELSNPLQEQIQGTPWGRLELLL